MTCTCENYLLQQGTDEACPAHGLAEVPRQNPKVPGISPATIVEVGKTSTEELTISVQKTWSEHRDLLDKYHQVWYNANHTWPYTHFLGIGMMKCPNDLWIYQAIMTELRPMTVIETGTYQGASALWFAYLMDMLGIDGGKVITVDFEDHRINPQVLHPRITYLGGNSVDPKLVEAVKDQIMPGPMLICLDSDHSERHVRAELDLYAPLTKPGDWLVVEDTNIGWNDPNEHKVSFNGDIGRCSCGMKFLVFEELREKVKPEDLEKALRRTKCPVDRTDRGARGGLMTYMEDHPGEFRQDVLSERYLLTMNPGGWLQRVGECNHG